MRAKPGIVSKNITIKLIFLIVSITLLFSVLAVVVQSRRGYQEYLDEVADYITFLQESDASSILQNAYDINIENINLISDGIIRSGKISYVKIVETRDGVPDIVFSEKGEAGAYGDTLQLEYNEVIPNAGSNQSVQMILHSDVVPYREYFVRDVADFLFSTLLFLLPLVFVIYVLLYRIVIRHVVAIANYTNRVDFDEQSLDPLQLTRASFIASGEDEIGILEKSVNNFVARILGQNIEKLKYTEEIATVNRLLNSVQELTSMGGWTYDIRKKDMFWTDEVFRIHGMPPLGRKDADELIGRSLECYLEPDRDTILRAFQRCIETGAAYDMDFEFIDFRKKRKWIRTGAQSIREGEEVVAVLGYITDITREKQEEIDLKRAKEKAEENDSLKSAFLNNISHELRTPMNSILGFSEILIRPGLEEQQRITYTRVLHKSIRKLLETVENTLTIAHLQTHQIVLNPIEFPVERLLTDSLREARVKLSEQEKNHIGVQLVGDCVGVYLRADFTKLQTCLNILIDNAIKFTEKGRIEIAFEAGESDVIFQISDTGSGFPEDKKHIAFQAFAQGDDQVRLNHGGLGLGLSICSGLIHLMRGRLELETEGTEGTRIRILLNKSMVTHGSE